MSAPRVRFAPSPTGHLHVGNARTALFNWLMARGQDGVFILRIEDTDAERSTTTSEHAILEDLRWLGLDWDEGPDLGGRHSPYRQSERGELYRSYARDLVDRNRAYYCFCTPAELEAERKAALNAGAAPKYSGRCRSIDPEAAAGRVLEGESAAIRFEVPGARDVVFEDLVRGEVTFNTDVIGDPVIVRSDGRPAYNFAVVVDDALMEVTHVIRGEDHISNTPRQILLYEALGFAIPQFGHLSMVLGPDHAPLSKRHGATSVGEFRERGFLPESLVNYLALLGWSPGDSEELVDVREMARRFDVRKVSHSAAVFDLGKLSWMNRHYMKEAAPARIARESLIYFVRAGFITRGTDASLGFLTTLLPMAVGSVDRLEEIPDRVAFLFSWDASRASALVAAEPDGARAIRAMRDEIVGAGPLDRDLFRGAVSRVREKIGLKGRALLHPVRVAITAADSGPELDLVIPAIDRGAVLDAGSGVMPVRSCAERLRVVTELLG